MAPALLEHTLQGRCEKCSVRLLERHHTVGEHPTTPGNGGRYPDESGLDAKA